MQKKSFTLPTLDHYFQTRDLLEQAGYSHAEENSRDYKSPHKLSAYNMRCITDELYFDRNNDANLDCFVELIRRFQNQGIDFELDEKGGTIRIMIKSSNYGMRSTTQKSVIDDCSNPELIAFVLYAVRQAEIYKLLSLIQSAMN